MTTDTALGVTKLVVHDHVPLNDIPYLASPLYKSRIIFFYTRLTPIV